MLEALDNVGLPTAASPAKDPSEYAEEVEEVRRILILSSSATPAAAKMLAASGTANVSGDDAILSLVLDCAGLWRCL